jgi:ubiquinone/menaquinone biosynthesis C-methylase UbiE
MTDENISQNFDATYYDEKYFADTQGISFCKPDGSTDYWGYKNPNGEWLGCRPIVSAWKFMFQPRNILDIGCGRGTFIYYAREIGILAEGFDFSEWVIGHLYPRCNKEWVKLHDAMKPWPYPDENFDLVTVLDLMENVYIDDIDFVINEMYRVAKKWIFLQITTVGKGHSINKYESGYILKKDNPVPIELQTYAVAGHVSVLTEASWLRRLKRDEWIVRKDLVERFCKIVPSSVIANWVVNTIIILERKRE